LLHWRRRLRKMNAAAFTQDTSVYKTI